MLGFESRVLALKDLVIISELLCHFKSSWPHLFLEPVTLVPAAVTSAEISIVWTLANLTLANALASHTCSDPGIPVAPKA